MAAQKVDVDGRTPLQLAMQLGLPAEQLKMILEYNSGAASLPLVNGKTTLSITVPGDLSDDNRDVVAKLPNNHTAFVEIPKDLNPGQVFRTESTLDAKLLYLKIPLKAAPGAQFEDAISSGQGISVEIPQLEKMRLHPSKKFYWHPFEMPELENLDYFVPLSSKAGEKGHVYTQEGSYMSIIVPKKLRGAASNRVPLVVKPHHPTHEGNDEYLLHAAVGKSTQIDVGGNEETIEILCEAFPEAAQKKNRYNVLPLHLLCVDSATVKSMEAVLKAYPEAAGIKTSALGPDNGDLPLHILLQNAGLGVVTDVQVAVMLLDAYPEALLEKDSLGNYPLHSALNKFGDMEAFVLRALEVHIEGGTPAAMKSADDSYPLHLALENGSSLETIKKIALAFPEAIMEQRRDGTTNLSNICIQGDRRLKTLTYAKVRYLCDILDYFFETYPALLTDKVGTPPMHLVLNSASADRLVRTVVAAHMEAGNLQEILLSDLNDCQDQVFCMMMEQDRGHKFIKQCIDSCDSGDDVRELMHVRNSDGMNPTSVTMDSCTRRDVTKYIIWWSSTSETLMSSTRLHRSKSCSSLHAREMRRLL